ncbi:MAG: exodeoxyribonuclease V subunit alpha [Gammaproteobacteria bacterium]|nr:exodeoxyribonuclease V subunit alpha [Gammaproteobacteria bacterium]
MNELTLRQAGLSELACQFARFIDRLNDGDDALVATVSALLSDAVSQGHVCLNLDDIYQQDIVDCKNKADLLIRLNKSHVVGSAGNYAPLILTDQGLLYLYRYWQDEQTVAKAIRHRCQSMDIISPETLQRDFSGWQSKYEGIDWQKVAVLMALTRKFSVISGGPGTGKTTIVLRLLKMLHGQSSELKIALAAPTGKAAARLQQAISESGNPSLEAKTVHRLLGITTKNDKGRYSQQRALPVDVLIVDEASMIDISLMAKVMHALPATARLILLGDSQQLASVESGAVLANLCAKTPSFSAEFIEQVKAFTGITLNNPENTEGLLTNSVVLLQQSYRFDDDSDIGQLAKAVQQGNVQAVYDVINQSQKQLWQQNVLATNIQTHTFEGYRKYVDAIAQNVDAETCLAVFEHYRILCALKNGPQSVTSINELMERALQKQGWKTHQPFYHGRPIMVTQNDYRQQLFNGDTGLVLYDDQGVLRACFSVDNSVRWINLSRLPAHETAFAITIHKSQGSEFDSVSVLLPEEESALLTRELLYTAITRAKQHVTLLSSDVILNKTVITGHQRETGLASLLDGK